MRFHHVFLFIISACALSCAKKEPNHYVLKLKGSESMHETFLALKSDFEKMQDSISINLDGGGSRTGMIGVYNETVDIGLSSFAFDLDSLLGEGHDINQKVVAFDGIVLISNEKNPIEQLTEDQIAGIFKGAFTNWRELGAPDGEIFPVIRDENSGTQRFFTNYFGIEEVVGSAKVAAENAEIVANISRNQNGIGFIGFAYFTESVHNISLPSVNENDTPFVSPSFKNLASGSYPLKRPLQIYFKNGNDPKVKAFISYLETERAQLVIATHGLVPVNN